MGKSVKPSGVRAGVALLTAAVLMGCADEAARANGAIAAQDVAALPDQGVQPPPLRVEQTLPSLTPPDLNPLLGPLILRGGAGAAVPAIGEYDRAYERTEIARYRDFLKVENDPGGAYLDANHYGGLRPRLMWAVRNAEPWGPEALARGDNGYSRGVRIVRRYLRYSKANKFNVPIQHNTSLADLELLYRLEGDEDALTHIQITATSFTTDQYNYLKVRNPNSGIRIPAVALQAFNAAHRLGIPYEQNDANRNIGLNRSLGSWKAAGDRLIQWIDQYEIVKPDGSTFSPSNKGDTYFMDAMLAVELLRWCAYVEWNPRAFEIARLVMDHLIASVPPGQTILGYQDNNRRPAADLAAFYVWPSLVLWQETGDERYRTFALTNLAATRNAYLQGMKQWNQSYSTMAQDAEALLAGVPWR